MATSAAAPPPTALKSETSCGMAVICTVRAIHRPTPAADGEADHDDGDGRRAQPARPSGQVGDGHQDRQRHAAGREAVAGSSRGRRVHLVQTEHEAGGAGQPGQEDEGIDPLLGHHSPSVGLAGATGFLRNIWSMRSVTT